jgi:hypothetical protein
MKYISKIINKTNNFDNSMPLFLFHPHYEQSIEDEYDIDLLFSHNLLNNEEKKEYSYIVFDTHLEISQIY